MSMVGWMSMPADFPYREVFRKGRPQHEMWDSFCLKHPKMDVGKRAKIFAPFDALRGFSEEVASKEVLYADPVCLEEEEQKELDRRLNLLHNLTFNGRMARQNRVQVRVTFYGPCGDTHSEFYGIRGQHRTIAGICGNGDAEVTQTILVGGERIPLAQVVRVEGEGIFDREETDPES